MSNPPPSVCFVCSAARSGSTMLDLVIGGHSEVASLGEFSFLGKALSLDQPCTCGAKVRECPAWKQIFDSLRNRDHIDLLQNPYAMEDWLSQASTVVDHAHQTKLYVARLKAGSAWSDLRYAVKEKIGLNLPFNPHQRKALANMASLYDHLSTNWGVSTLVDSSKNVHRALAMNEVAPEQVRILFLTRDGRGVYHSRRKSGFSQEEALAGWRRYNARAHRLLSTQIESSQVYRVHYEALVANPEDEVAGICDFLGLDFESEMLTIRPNESHLVNGNDMRLKGTQTLRADQRWKTDLAPEELAWFNRNERGMNRQLGYD